MTRIVIHPGFHKTGTTALQQALAQSRIQLLDQKIWYPDLGGEAHHRLAFALNGRSWGWENRGGKVVPISEWRKFVARANRFQGTVVLSSESLIELTEVQLKQLQLDLQGFETRVVFSYRPLPSILVSIYQQYVKAGLQTDIDSWLKNEFSDGIHRRQTRLWRRHSHDILVERWLNVFEDVTLIVADPSNPSFLFDTFEQEIGLANKTLQIENVSNINRSLSVEELNLLLEINRQVHDKYSWDEYLYFIRGGVRQVTNAIPFTESGTRMGLPQWAFDAALSEHTRQWEQISELSVKTIFQSLDEQILSTLISDNKDSKGISDEYVAQLMQHLSFGEVVKKISTKKLLRELLIRIGFRRDSRLLHGLAKLINLRRSDNK